MPAGIERMELRPFQQAVAIGVQGRHELNGLFHLGPDARQEAGIRGHAVFAVNPQDGAALPVSGKECQGVVLGLHAGVSVAALRPIVHGAVRLEGDAVIDMLPHMALQSWEQAGHRLGVLPDVLTGALAAVHAFPGVEAVGVEPVAGLGGQGGGVGKGAVQKPVRQGGVVPGLHP